MLELRAAPVTKRDGRDKRDRFFSFLYGFVTRRLLQEMCFRIFS
jgi:hypothetical protein